MANPLDESKQAGENGFNIETGEGLRLVEHIYQFNIIPSAKDVAMKIPKIKITCKSNIFEDGGNNDFSCSLCR